VVQHQQHSPTLVSQAHQQGAGAALALQVERASQFAELPRIGGGERVGFAAQVAAGQRQAAGGRQALAQTSIRSADEAQTQGMVLFFEVGERAGKDLRVERTVDVEDDRDVIDTAIGKQALHDPQPFLPAR